MKKIRISRTVFKTIIMLVGFAVVIVAFFLVINKLGKSVSVVSDANEEYSGTSDEQDAGTIYYNGNTYVMNKNISTFLVIGTDELGAVEKSDSYNNSVQSDFLLLAIFNNEDKTYKLLQLNRDTMTEINVLGVTGESAGTFVGQLALAHTYGSGLQDSCENTVKAVSNLLYGVDIDNYASLTMSAVSVLNDLVGGVEVTVLDDFSGIDSTLVKGQSVLLSGNQALTYVRARGDMPDSTNLARMARQKQYMPALTEKLQSAEEKDANFAVTAFKAIAEYMVGNINISDFSRDVSKISDYTYEGVLSPEGEAKQGDKYIEYYVDEGALKDLVISLFYQPASADSN